MIALLLINDRVSTLNYSRGGHKDEAGGQKQVCSMLNAQMTGRGATTLPGAWPDLFLTMFGRATVATHTLHCDERFGASPLCSRVFSLRTCGTSLDYSQTHELTRMYKNLLIAYNKLEAVFQRQLHEKQRRINRRLSVAHSRQPTPGTEKNTRMCPIVPSRHRFFRGSKPQTWRNPRGN